LPYRDLRHRQQKVKPHSRPTNVAAAMLDPADADDIRIAVRALAHGGRRFHWRNEESKDRRKAASVVSDLDSLHVIVVGTGLDNARQERGRRECLERLLWELAGAGSAMCGWTPAVPPRIGGILTSSISCEREVSSTARSRSTSRPPRGNRSPGYQTSSPVRPAPRWARANSSI
jgi:hypothetical protein